MTSVMKNTPFCCQSDLLSFSQARPSTPAPVSVENGLSMMSLAVAPKAMSRRSRAITPLL
jgi:hypothetical protein